MESEEDQVRGELVAQLKESLVRSRIMMLNDKLEAKARERWTQIHTNTAQVLNQILRDRQFKEWEKRLKEMEARGRILRRTVKGLEGLEARADPEAGGVSDGKEPVERNENREG